MYIYLCHASSTPCIYGIYTYMYMSMEGPIYIRYQKAFYMTIWRAHSNGHILSNAHSNGRILMGALPAYPRTAHNTHSATNPYGGNPYTAGVHWPVMRWEHSMCGQTGRVVCM